VVGPALAVPLAGSGTVRAVLCAGQAPGRPPFAATDVEMAGGFAIQAAVAIELAEARSEQQRAVLLDERERIAADLQGLLPTRPGAHVPDGSLIVLAERLEDGGSPLGVPPLSIRLSGEIDLLAMPELRRTLVPTVPRGRRQVDHRRHGRDVPESFGHGALLLARAAASRAHGDVTLTGASRCLQS
jgi:hypothetical protein